MSNNNIAKLVLKDLSTYLTDLNWVTEITSLINNPQADCWLKCWFLAPPTKRRDPLSNRETYIWHFHPPIKKLGVSFESENLLQFSYTINSEWWSYDYPKISIADPRYREKIDAELRSLWVIEKQIAERI